MSAQRPEPDPTDAELEAAWNNYVQARAQHPPLRPANLRIDWCRIHGERNHLQRAVCHECLKPLTAELAPTCWHPAAGDYVYWRCWEGLNG